jgi:hypothetical protein
MANQVAYAKYFTETMKVDTTYLASLRAVVKNVTESTPTVGDLTAAINLAVEPTKIKLAAASSYVMGYTGMLGCGAASCINSIDLRAVSAKFGNDGQLLSYTNLANPTFEALSIGTASVSDLGGNADLTWGRWNAGTLSGTYGNQNFTKTGLRENNGFHYVMGVNTATLPSSGKAEYVAIAATMPTVTATALEPAPGVLELSASRMVVDFSSGKVGFEMAFSYPSYALRGWGRTVLKSAGGASDPAASAFSFGAGFTGLKAASGSGVNPVQYFADGADVTSYFGSRTTAYILPFGADASHLALIFSTYHKDAGIVIFKKTG